MTTRKIIPEQVHALAAKGFTQREIAEQLGCSHVTVGNVLRHAEPAPHRVHFQPQKADPPAPQPLADRLVAVATLLTDCAQLEEPATVWEAINVLRATADADATPEPDAPLEGEPLEIVTALLHESRRDAARHAKVGNASAASRSQRTAAMLAPVVARLAKEQRSDGGGLFVSRAYVDCARGELTELFGRLTSRPLMCATCSRELSVQLAEQDEPQ